MVSKWIHGDEQIEWEHVNIIVDPGEMIGFYTYLSEDSQRVEIDYLADVCGSASTFFDVGANRAWVSLALGQRCSQIQVVGFEPDPSIAQLARSNMSLNPAIAKRIVLREHAVGDQNGELLFARSPADNLGTGRLDSNATADGIRVQCLTLDSVCEELGLWPDVIKIDVEGAELAVLRGLATVLRTRPPKAMLVELHGFYLDDFRGFYLDIYNLLTSAGYRLRQMHKHGFGPAAPPADWPSRLHLAAEMPDAARSRS